MILSFSRDADWPAEKEWLLAHHGVALESEEGGEAIIRLDLACRYLEPTEDGLPASCRLQERKPGICAEYPDKETLEYLKKHPGLTPDCGYLDGEKRRRAV